MLAAAGGEPKRLLTTLLLLRHQGLLSEATLVAMLAAAQQCNLPPDFLSAFTDQPLQTDLSTSSGNGIYS